ncbi:hypothetical protein [Moellerella wisconsensis]|uniref:Uncharacterized protein n=1 Tax=Moellerella wisconsensis TaxID=158849 RepID=A0A9Q8V494_9GAMM|nr:hypothetical protein [Moellerella wisconsensis]UNH31144.1 hypothetical protein MNY72_02105 [Moellerella wisconsensis]
MISKLQFNQLAEKVNQHEIRLSELEQIISAMQRKHSIPEGMASLTTLAAEMGLSTSKAELLAKNCGVLVIRQSHQLIVNEAKFREAATIIIKGAKRKIGSKYWFHPLIGKFTMSSGVKK